MISMQKTKIEWCDSSWNPVTGCLHGCQYCYARGIANRFAGCDSDSTYGEYSQATWHRVNPESPKEEAIFEVDAKCPPVNVYFDKENQVKNIIKAPYPWGFQPTLRRDKLDEFLNKKSRTIFVCSMADLFGEWVPDSWIEEVFEACIKAPQHRYLFLTKNPKRYSELALKKKLPVRDNMWYGSTSDMTEKRIFWEKPWHAFISIEPILNDCNKDIQSICNTHDWVIVGAETGNRKEKVVPERDWIEYIIKVCADTGTPLLLKDSLIPIIGEENMVQQFPWKI